MPDVPSFAVDDGFAYSVPDTLGSLEVGSIVRVPLGGRRVRGWVTDVRETEPARPLRDVAGKSGDRPIFDHRLLEVMRWAALHYVAPLAGVLPKAGPPNLPRGSSGVQAAPNVGEGRRSRFVASAGPYDESVRAAAARTLEKTGSLAVLVPTAQELLGLVATLRKDFGDRVLAASSSLPDAEVTRAWMRIGEGDAVLVGTTEIALWRLPGLAQLVVLDPGRRGFKAKQTPTIHARDIVRRRSGIERFAVTWYGAVPPVELLAAGIETEENGARSWPLIEVADRSEEPPGTGLVLDRTRQAIHGVVAAGGTVVVYVPRRGYAPAFRCARCGTLRRCGVCGAAPGNSTECARCGGVAGPCTTCGSTKFQALGVGVGRAHDELARSLGDQVGEAGSDRAVLVGTERDLPSPGSCDLAVALEPDGLWLAPNYRAEEEALRILARVAGTVRRGRGRRCLLQTSQPDHRVVEALRSGRAAPFLRRLLAERESAGLPPSGDLIAIEVGGEPGPVDSDLREATEGADVFGPAETADRWRWLVQGADLRQSRVRLRASVQSWRDQGFSVRIDADPIDL